MPSPQDLEANVSDQERRFLIAAGTGKFDNQSVQELEHVESDLQLIVECFTHPKFGYTRVLPELGENPSLSTLRESLKIWFRDPSLRPKDKLVFYYSGHGERKDEPNRRHYLLTSDSNYDSNNFSIRDAFPVEELLEEFILVSPIQQVLIILDTCFSGKGISNLSALAALAEQKWRNPDGPFGIIFFASARSHEFAKDGAFTKIFTDIIKNEDLSLGHYNQEYLKPGDTIYHINEILKEKHPSQQAVWNFAPPLSELPDLIPNPQYQADPRWHRDLIDHWLLHARGSTIQTDVSYFTGREEVLTDLVQWLKAPMSGGKARVVTGGPGTGKSAILARLVTLADPKIRAKMEVSEALKGVREDTLPPKGAVDIAIHASGKRLDDIIRIIATEVNIGTEDASTLVEALVRRKKRLVIVIDALDEAKEPKKIARDLLKGLTGYQHLWLLVGSRPDTAPGTRGKRLLSIGSGTVEIDLDDQEKYPPQKDIANYVMRRLLAAEEPDKSTPYRDKPELAQKVAEVVTKNASPVFLVAQIASWNLIEADEPVDVTTWKFPADICDAFDQFLDRFDELEKVDLDKQKVKELLAPLAYAEGKGLPREMEIWPRLASAISGATYQDRDIRLLLDHASAYIVVAQEDGRSVYRLYHPALSDCLQDQDRTLDIQQYITETLKKILVERCEQDWFRAPAYIRKHLATHAAASGTLDDLVNDPAYLLAADPSRLLHAFRTTTEKLPSEIIPVYQRAVHHLQTKTTAEAASYLEMFARQDGANHLANQIAKLPLWRPWTTLWANWQYTGTHQVITRHQAGIFAVTVSEFEDRPVIISGGADETVRICDLADGRQIGQLHTSHRHIRAVKVSELEGRPVIISGGWDGTVQVWDLAKRKPIGQPLTAHRDGVRAVEVSKLEGRPVIVSGGADGAVRVWDLAKRKPIGKPLAGHQGAVRAVKVSELKDRPVIVSGNADGTVQVWDLAKRKPIGQPLVGHKGSVEAVTVGQLKDRPVIISGGRDGSIRVWDLAERKPIGQPLTAHQGGVEAVKVSEFEGRPVIVSGGRDGSIRVWDMADGGPIGQPLAGHPGSVFAVTVSQIEGRPVIVSGGGDGTVRVWDMANIRPNGQPLTTHQNWVEAITVGQLEDRSVIISGSADGTVCVWDLADGKPVNQPLTTHQNWVEAVKVSELEGRPVIVSGGRDGSIRVWDLAEQTLIGQPLPSHPGGIVEAIAIGQLQSRPVIVSGGTDEVRIWDLAEQTLIGKPLIGHRHVMAVDVGELEGRPVIVLGSWDGIVRVWDMAEQTLIGQPLPGQKAIVQAVAVSQLEGRPVIVSGSADGIVRVWDMAEQTLIGQPLVGHKGGVQAVAVSQLQGRPVIVSGDLETVRVWQLNGQVKLIIEVDTFVTDITPGPSSKIAVATPKGLMVIQLRENEVP